MKYFLTLFILLSCIVLSGAQDITSDTTQASKLYRNALTYYYKARYDKSLQNCRRAAALYKKHRLWKYYYTVCNDEIWCLISLGQLENAQKFGEEYLKEVIEKSPKFDIAKANFLHSLGAAYYKLSQYKKALSHYRESLTVKTELLGKTHTGVAQVYMGMAVVYDYQQQYAKALEYYQKSLSIDLENFGEKHVNVGILYNNIALVYQNRLQYEKALAYCSKSLNVNLELLGEKHISVAATYMNMAIIYYGQALYKKSLKYYRKSLNINLKLLGEKHENVAGIYLGMGITYYSLSKYAKALRYSDKSLAIFLELFGEKHAAVAFIYDSYGSFYYELGEYEKAAEFHHKAVCSTAIGFESNDLGHNPETAQALEKNDMMLYLQNKALVLAQLNRSEEALRAYAAAAACAEAAMREALRTEDKLGVVSRAYQVNTKAALLHFKQYKGKAGR